MATYYGTYGQKVQYLASDPSDPQTGQVWYNSTSAVLKVRSATTTGTFASGGTMATARQLLASAGTQTAALGFGGTAPYTGQTESYNGTSWTTLPASLNTARAYLAGCGTQTSALGATGYNAGFPTATETYDGTSWTSVNSVSTARAKPGISGVQTAALIFGGSSPFPGGTGVRSISESWNGTSWTSAPSINTARFQAGSSGTQTAALMFAGSVSSPVAGTTNTNATESYNGTSWTTLPATLPFSNRVFTGNGTMTQTSAVATGGGPPESATTAVWNGTTWTANPTSLSTNRNRGGVAGDTANTLFFAGSTPGGNLANTEEFTGPGTATTKTVTVS